jgi:hypothetical protein
MLRKISLSLFASASILALSAQDSTMVETPKPLVISGYVDAYYRFNFSNPKGSTGATNNFTSFTNSHNSFELGMASVKLEHTSGKVGLVADLGFGRRAEEFSYTDGDVDQDKNGFLTLAAVKQAYITYAPTSNLKFTAGSFATHVGYELVDPYLNRNYSMSYMFSYGPFFHTGLKADLTAGKSGFMLGVANPTDFKTASFSQKWLIAQYSLAASDKVKLYANYQGGNLGDAMKTRLRHYDLVLTAGISDKFSIGYNGTVQNRTSLDATTKDYENGNSWWGSALYLNIDPTSTFGLTLRGEYFSDKKGVLTDVNGDPLFASSFFVPTLSANIKVGGLTLIPELRLDNSSDTEPFVKRDGSTTKSTLSGLFAAVYKF